MFHPVPAPMFISARLMAAYVVPSHLMGGAPVGTLHLSATGTDAEGRQGYTYVIESADGTELGTGSDLSSGVGSDVDYLAMMCTLISFLESASECDVDCADGCNSGFPVSVVEWASASSDELAYARELIDMDADAHSEDCTVCLSGETSDHVPDYPTV